jgi:molybdenum cofactor synthesis domain-containing protein
MNHEEVHPMVPVPDAIRTVMRETAKLLLNNQKPNPTLRISLSSTPWSSLLGCILDEDVLMEEPGYPPYNASIMDGYAINTSDFSSEDAKNASTTEPDSWTHRVVDRIYAGGSGAKSTTEDEDNLPLACYITTGAVVPDCYNCVVPVEECEVSVSTPKIQIKPTASLQHHKWIRPIGCDISGSTIVLPKGHILDPVAIGLAKQSGAEYITVKRRIKVGVLSTGNELIVNDANDDIGRESKPQNQKGKIPDVNRPVLLSMLSTSTFQNTCEPIDLGTVRDDNLEAMVETVESALDRCDIIITTGGVSMGETDVVERVLVNRCGGTLHFGRMHMKPGKPTTFVTIPRKVNGDSCVKLVFAQPGNPCSAVVCTRLLVGPCLDLYFQGIDRETFEAKSKTKEEQVDEIVNTSFVHPEIEARLTHDIKLDPKRPEYHRVILTRKIGDIGETYEALSTGVQRS